MASGFGQIAVRVEIDSALEGGDARRQAFGASVCEALQSLPSYASPSLCAWNAARGCNVAAKADHVTPIPVEQLAAYAPESNWGDGADLTWLMLLLLGPAIAFCCWAHGIDLLSHLPDWVAK